MAEGVSQNVNIDLLVGGAEQATTQLNSVTSSLGNMDDASKKVATKFGGLASASSALGTILSQTTPRLAGLAAIMGTTGGAVSGLVTALGGAAGVATGGLVLALGLVVKWFYDSGKAADEAKDKYIAAAKAAITASQSFRVAMAEEARAERKRMGVETAADFAAQFDEYNEQLKKAKSEYVELQRDTKFFLSDEGKVRAKTLEIQIDSLAISKRKAMQFAKQVTEIRTIDEEAENLTEQEQKILDKLNAQLKTTKSIRKETEKWADIVKDLAGDGDVTQLLEEFDPVEEELEPRYQEYLDNREKMLAESLARIKKQEEDAAAAFSNTWQGSLSIVQSGFNDVAANMLAGNEVSLENILSMMGTQIIKDGIKNMWVAGGMLLNPITAGSGGALMGYAAAEIAAGTAMAQAGGAASGDTGGGPGGAGGTSGLAPARPTPVAEDILRQRQETPTTIHVHTLNPSVESGIAIDKSLTAARNKRGRYAMTYRN